MSSVEVLKQYPIQKFEPIDLSTIFQVTLHHPWNPCEDMNARFTTLPKPSSVQN